MGEGTVLPGPVGPPVPRMLGAELLGWGRILPGPVGADRPSDGRGRRPRRRGRDRPRGRPGRGQRRQKAEGRKSRTRSGVGGHHGLDSYPSVLPRAVLQDLAARLRRRDDLSPRPHPAPGLEARQGPEPGQQGRRGGQDLPQGAPRPALHPLGQEDLHAERPDLHRRAGSSISRSSPWSCSRRRTCWSGKACSGSAGRPSPFP